jgi:ABC-type iron transport system FetAB ATPase subunit
MNFKEKVNIFMNLGKYNMMEIGEIIEEMVKEQNFMILWVTHQSMKALFLMMNIMDKAHYLAY